MTAALITSDGSQAVIGPVLSGTMGGDRQETVLTDPAGESFVLGFQDNALFGGTDTEPSGGRDTVLTAVGTEVVSTDVLSRFPDGSTLPDEQMQNMAILVKLGEINGTAAGMLNAAGTCTAFSFSGVHDRILKTLAYHDSV